MKTGHTLFELQTGRMFSGPGAKLIGLPDGDPMQTRAYFNELQALLTEYSKQAEASDPAGGEKETLPTAEWVRLRVYKRKWLEPRWTGPFRVTERTSHAVRLQGKGETWFHWSQCTPAEEPSRSLHQVYQDLQASRTDSAESGQTETGSVASSP